MKTLSHTTGKLMRLTWIGMLLLITGIAQAQVKTIQGLVLDETDQPLTGATVYTSDKKSSAITDLDLSLIHILLGLGYVIYFWLSRNKAVKSLSENVSTVMGDMPEGSKKQENRGTELEGENILVAKPIENYFDRSRSAISLLGTFNVRDKEGNDITSNFTPRLKSLLVLLILYTEKNEKGILTRKMTEMLWSDKDEIAARNNRNVTLRKLRVLLEEVGDVEDVYKRQFTKL